MKSLYSKFWGEFNVCTNAKKEVVVIVVDWINKDLSLIELSRRGDRVN